MLINQQQRDEVELALSCTDHEYRLPVKHHHKKTDYTTSGFSREEAKEILIEFYRDIDWPPESPDNQYHLNK